MKKVIIIGASSGIGEALCKIYSENGYEVGMASRRVELMETIAQELTGKSYIQHMDVSQPEEAIKQFQQLLNEMETVDIIIINSGAGHKNPDLTWPLEKLSIDVNIAGFTAMAGVAFNYLKSKGEGNLVGVSSIAGIRGNRFAPAYSSSKAYISQYLNGLRQKVMKEKLNISIIDICPGFVDTAMAQGDKIFWSASPEKAAKQIYNAIFKKKNIAYISRRWILIAWLLKLLPDFIYNKI